jgi:hypothetical protein
MTINLFQNNSDKNVVSKSLTAKGTVTGTLREDCSIIDPVIKIEGISGSDLPYLNYLEVVDFGRYYYITDIVLTGKLYECHCHIDVLETYKDQIKVLPAVIARQESQNNVMLTDGLIKTYANPEIEIRRSSGGFTDFQYIFCVAG